MSTLHTLRLHALACAVVSCLCAPAALAQDTAAAARAADSAAVNLDSVFVTGTSTATTKLKSSVSVSTVGAEAIEQSAPRSTAEIFRNIPGIRSESSGGEGNANIAVRGLPVASGGAKFLLQEDGLPVMEFGDIAFGNSDIFLRSDFTLDRIEAIRGGSASTFTSNAPGGIINFISKTGDTAGGSVGVSRGLTTTTPASISTTAHRSPSSGSSISAASFARATAFAMPATAPTRAASSRPT